MHGPMISTELTMVFRSFNVSKLQRKDTNGGPKWGFLQYKQGFLVRSITMPYSRYVDDMLYNECMTIHTVDPKSPQSEARSTPEAPCGHSTRC